MSTPVGAPATVEPPHAEGPVSLYAEFDVVAGAEAEVAALVAALVLDVRAEPGCEVFDAFVRADDPHRYVVVETYRDRDAFAAHLGSAHGREFNRRLAPLVAGGGSRLTWLLPVPATPTAPAVPAHP